MKRKKRSDKNNIFMKHFIKNSMCMCMCLPACMTGKGKIGRWKEVGGDGGSCITEDDREQWVGRSTAELVERQGKLRKNGFV